MGSSSSKQNKDNIYNRNLDSKIHVATDAHRYNFATYNRDTATTQYVHKNDYLRSQVNNPSKDSNKPFNDLSKSAKLAKSATNKPSNDLSKSATYNLSNDLSKTVPSRLVNIRLSESRPAPNIGLSKSAIRNPNDTITKIKHTNNLDSKIYDCEKNKCKHCNSYHTFSEQGELNTYCPKLSKVDHKDRVTPSNFKKDVFFTKEKHSSENQKNYIENEKPTYLLHLLSLKNLTKDNFTTMWFSWKNDFLTYMKSIDSSESDKKKWGMMLLNRLGPVGQEIYRTFQFDDDQANDDIDILLEKFNQYCTFGNKKRTNDEDIDVYVNNLKVMASKYTSNVNEIVKKKILEEIDVTKFTNTAKTLIPEFSFPSDIKFLTIQEVTYIWIKYENGSFKQNEKIDHFSVRNCNKCSLNHAINRCPANGKQCNKCGNMNHHWSRCPSQYKENCSYCGESHFYRQCPAYMSECSKCHKVNHFYWMCGFPKVLNCNYCGLSHIASKSACFAINIICTKCNKKGHVSSKCEKLKNWRK